MQVATGADYCDSYDAIFDAFDDNSFFDVVTDSSLLDRQARGLLLECDLLGGNDSSHEDLLSLDDKQGDEQSEEQAAIGEALLPHHTVLETAHQKKKKTQSTTTSTSNASTKHPDALPRLLRLTYYLMFVALLTLLSAQARRNHSDSGAGATLGRAARGGGRFAAKSRSETGAVAGTGSRA